MRVEPRFGFIHRGRANRERSVTQNRIEGASAGGPIERSPGRKSRETPPNRLRRNATPRFARAAGEAPALPLATCYLLLATSPHPPAETRSSVVSSRTPDVRDPLDLE